MCEVQSKDNYFLITNPIDMETILVKQGFKPGVDTVIIGPCNDRPGTTKLGNNQSITQEEAQALKILNTGYNGICIDQGRGNRKLDKIQRSVRI